MKNFFISYHKSDELWAEWVAWQLEEAGYSTIVQVWDFAAGGNFVAQMQKAARECQRTIALLSEEYLNASFTQPEWQAAFARDPTGEKRLLVPIRVRECNPEGLLPQIVYVDLVGIDADQARKSILQHVSDTRSKPKAEPWFPGCSKSDHPKAPKGLQSEETIYEIPFVIGVLADLSAHSANSKPDLSERNFVEITPESFEVFLGSCSPRLKFRVEDCLANDGSKLLVELRFKQFPDFSPISVAAQIPQLNEIYRRRTALHQLLVRIQTHPKLEQLISDMLQNTELIETLAMIHEPEMKEEQSSKITNANPLPKERMQALSDFRSKLSRFPNMHTEKRCLEVERTIFYLIDGNFLWEETALATFRLAVAQLDATLNDQITPVVQNREFLRLEATWRGLHTLVNQIGLDPTLRLKALDISKYELLRSITNYKHGMPKMIIGSYLSSKTVSESPLFTKLNQELELLGGNPFGCLIGDYFFNHSSADVALLDNMAFLAAKLKAPFFAGADSSIFGIESWAKIDHVGRHDQIFDLPEYSDWNCLRKKDRAKFIGLALPRFLVRQPHKREEMHSNDFVFNEDTVWYISDERFCWCNSVFLLASNIAQSFKNTGWFGKIQGIHGGGLVDGLFIFDSQSDSGETISKGPTEGLISDATEITLRRLGFIPLVAFKNTGRTVFFEIRSLLDTSGEQSSSVFLSSVLLASRLSHYFVCILRDQPRKLETKEEAKDYLERWILRYVEQDNASLRSSTKPLKAVDINTEDIPDSPGSFKINLSVQTIYDWDADERIQLGLSYNARS